jgi:hypothetical protein
MFGPFIKRWVNGVRLASGAYVRSTLKMIFFLKLFYFILELLRKFPRHRKVGNNKVSQNDFISEIQGTVKILLCTTINPSCLDIKTHYC